MMSDIYYTDNVHDANNVFAAIRESLQELEKEIEMLKMENQILQNRLSSLELSQEQKFSSMA